MTNVGRKSSTVAILVFITGLLLTCPPVSGQLSTGFYDSSCPEVESVVKSGVSSALISDPRIGASLLRLHFHDCFVDGCDGSVLLDDTATFRGEKTARPNNNSLRGFEVIDAIKASLEEIPTCQGLVSCADIVAIAARDGVVAAGGPSWDVELGRLDSLTASFANAESNLPGPFSTISALTSKFANVGLNETDVVVLSGGHSFGKAQCGTFVGRLYNFQGTGGPDPSIDPNFLQVLRARCPDGGDGTVLQDLDQGTPTSFDNSYYSNLLVNKGLLFSDQVLETTSGTSGDLVTSFGADQSIFFSQFQSSMLKMGRISPKLQLGSDGEIRTNCRVVNSPSTVLPYSHEPNLISVS